jgi:4-hydroxybenzoate polyprenyltransferase
MQWIFVIICFIITVGTAAYLKSIALHGGLTAAIVLLLVFLTIYSMARIKPKSQEAESGTNG